MVDVAPEIEITDEQGSTFQYGGIATTVPVLVPASAGDPIDEVLIRCPSQTPNSNILFWSIDGVTYHKLSVGEYVGLEPRKKGNTGLKIYQLYIKGNSASVEYEIIMNTGI